MLRETANFPEPKCGYTVSIQTPMTNTVTDYHWKPIEPLSDHDREIDLGAMRPLYESWRAFRSRLQEKSPAQLNEFSRRLVRRLSVETGIVERLYDLDRGTTEALVAYGFAEGLVSRSSTDIEPSKLLDILRDHEAAIQLIMDCVARSRMLTKGLMHELHIILTAHQDSTEAVDQFGTRYEIKLLKGRFKEQPNNPRRPDGAMHEYCPPVHVDAEIENMLHWLSEYSSEDPVIVAAWLHHRFTQIHPYQDGNGRVARALTTFVLLRAGLLPLIIDRDLRVDYIKSLESADVGELAPLAELFARLERSAILQASSVDADARISHQESLTSVVLESLADKFSKRRIQKLTELRTVNDVALKLRSLARTQLEEKLAEVETALRVVGAPIISINDGGPDHGNAYWYRFEVVQSAKEAHKFANFAEAHYFVKSSVQVTRERLIFVISFHHVGRELSGIMEATAFSKLVSYEDSDDGDSVPERFSLCSAEPFVFTNKTQVGDVENAFLRWVDAALAIAVKEYGDRL